MTVPAADAVARLKADPVLSAQLAADLYLPPEPVRYGELATPLAEPLAGALAGAGIDRLWSHQTEGLEAVRRGENVLVTTPTASGKSLVFHLPVLEAAAAERPGRALFLYPLKALGHDQRTKLEALASAAGLDAAGPVSRVYDGDTPSEEREAIKRDFPRVVISNPDMLHMGILGSWRRWAPFLGELEWIVLDELHSYRGIFGAHFHHVLERLTRICREQGAAPSIIASSATAANAGEFAGALAGREFHQVARSGAPRQGRHLLLFRPESSPYTLALELLQRLLEQGLKTIVFTKARRITELLYSWLRRQNPALAGRVASYRSGFLPEERRRIEKALFAGRLDGVISTSALEMGIDVGGLDACILVGFPGSVMATWQRSGRVGRAERESVTAMVALPDALDHYLLDHPRDLVDRPCERLVVDPSNEPVARGHLECAAAELPLAADRDRAYLERHAATVGDLLGDGTLRRDVDTGELCARRRRPQRRVSLRGGGRTATILAAGTGRVVGTVDGVRVLHECHPGAVYLHWGRQYLVRGLDLEASKVHAEAVSVDYFTTPQTEKDTAILEVLAEEGRGPLRSYLGRLRVTERVVGFERKRIQGRETIDRTPLDLPPVVFETVGLWWLAPREVEEALTGHEHHLMGSLHAAEHAAISLLPLEALCDRGDVGGISIPLHPQLGLGAVFLYDGHPGGVGIAKRAFERLPRLLGRVADLLGECPCDDGCPSCVQSPKCGNGNRPLDKAGAERFLRLLLGREGELGEAKPVTVAPAAEGAAGGESSSGEAALRAAAPPPPPDTVSPPAAAPAASATSGPAPGDEGGRGASDRGRRDGGPRATRESSVPGRGSGWDSAAAWFDGVDAPPPRRAAARREEGDRQSGDPASNAPPPADGSRPTAPVAQSAPPPAGVALEASPTNHPDAGEARRPVAPPAEDRSLGGRRGLVLPPIPAPLDANHTVLFDLETWRAASEVGGWDRAYRMRVAVGVVCHLEEGRFETFREEGVPELIARLEAAEAVVGFNSLRFDYQVLSGYTGIDYARRLPTRDLLVDVWRTLGFRLGLGALASATLGVEKSADGLKSLEWVRQGRFEEVEAYCRRDVELLRDLYLFGRRMGYLLYRDREGHRFRVDVDW